MAVSAYSVGVSSYFFVFFTWLDWLAVASFGRSWRRVAFALLTEVGLSHRRASNFLVRDKKVTKEARLPTAIRQNSLRACSAAFKQLPEV
ncbi:MAG: hypothetical protein RSE06_12690, partial [Comamonas sp.]